MASAADVVIVTHGRFHSFDLAEQVQGAGRLAGIITGYPRFKLRNTRVSQDLIRPFPWFQIPYLALARFRRMPMRALRELAWHGDKALNRYAARHLPDSCRLVSALSGIGRESGREIQRRGGIYVCDRGSTHIRWQNRIMAEEYARLGIEWGGIEKRVIENEEMEYAMADAISLPSRITLRSFVEMGVPEHKLRLLPYGVNVESFRRSEARAERFRIVFVGQLCVRKGLHTLLDVFSRLKLPGAELVVVGGHTPEADAILSRYPLDNVTLTGLLPRDRMIREMSLASVLVLPSIEEGLALVMAQALACGCPVIASTHTGAEDLFTDGEEGFIIAPGDGEALTERLVWLAQDRDLIESMGEKAVRRVHGVGGWDRYGRESLAMFDALLSATPC